MAFVALTSALLTGFALRVGHVYLFLQDLVFDRAYCMYVVQALEPAFLCGHHIFWPSKVHHITIISNIRATDAPAKANSTIIATSDFDIDTHHFLQLTKLCAVV
jgi:hypothetical protein